MTVDAHPSAARLRSARFYGILDAAHVAPKNFPGMCRKLLAGGADIIQVRAKKADGAAYRKLLESVLPLFADNEVPLIVNDHLDIALEYPRCGLHIGQDDVAVAAARALLGPERILGLSTHSVTQAEGALAQAHLLSYFCIGPVFATQTKPDYAPVGLELVRRGSALNAERLPLFCIGGINRNNVAWVREAGAKRVVVVSDVLLAQDPEAATRALRGAME